MVLDVGVVAAVLLVSNLAAGLVGAVKGAVLLSLGRCFGIRLGGWLNSMGWCDL